MDSTKLAPTPNFDTILTLLHIEDFPFLQDLTFLTNPHQLSKIWSYQCMHNQQDHSSFSYCKI